MSEPSEYSESGNPIYRYEPRKSPFEPAIGDPKHIQAIDEHIKKHIGEVSWVFHEIISDLVHIDVHFVNPTNERPFFTLVTSGMSARAMKVPEGAEELSYAELVLCLPPNWQVLQEDFKNEDNYWPIRLLKMLARMPHEYETWLGAGHTLPNGDPPEPLAGNTNFCGAILASPILAPDGFGALQATPELTIHFYSVIPLYAEEMNLKLSKGAEVLFERLEEDQVSELIDVKRKNVAKKRFGLF
ncbi:MAG: suppressor of fused domain protein [Verrucomicrobiota bacterium]